MPTPTPPIGADVTDLMPKVGEDVTALMEPASTTPTTPEAQPRGYWEGLLATPKEVAQGALAGAASTVFHGGDLIRRMLGMERIIDTPEVQAAMTPPQTFEGKAGKLLEQGAEFALPLSTVAKAAKTAQLGRLATWTAEGVAGAGIAGVQSGGDKGQMALAAAAPPIGAGIGKVAGGVVKAVRGAAAGAAEGGLGGAVAGAVRRIAPMESVSMMIQALKPRNSAVNFPDVLRRALPEIKQVEAAAGGPIETIDDLLAATKTAKQANRVQYNAIAGPAREMGTTVDTTPVAEAIVESIPKKLQIENPAGADKIKALADVYRKRMPLEDVEQLLKDTNAELEAYYKKFPMAQRKALLADPEIAHTVAQAGALRTALYNTLDAPGQGAAARELQRRYGALMEVEDTAQRRAMVAARQQPESLSEQIGKVRAAADLAKGVWRLSHGDVMGAADIAAAKAGSAAASYLKEQQTTNALIRRAMQAHHAMPARIEMPPQPVIRGLLPAGSRPLGPATRGGIDPSDLPGITVRGEYGARWPPAGTPSPEPPPRPVIRPQPSAEYKPAPMSETEREANGHWTELLKPPEGGKLNEVEHRELQRIYEELESMPFQKKFATDTAGQGRGKDLEWHAGGAGAKVYDDILGAEDLAGFERESGIGKPTRKQVAVDIKSVLEGQKMNRVAARALVVARARARGGYPRSLYHGLNMKIAGPLSTPQLPAWWEAPSEAESLPDWVTRAEIPE